MDLAGHFSDLVAYTGWANKRVLATLADLPAGELDQPIGAGILEAFEHIAEVQLRLCARMRGELPGSFEAVTLDEIARGLERSHDEMRDLADRDWESKPFAGTTDPAILLTQIALHGVQHRAEIGLMLETMGRSTGDLDYLLFKMEQLEAD